MDQLTARLTQIRQLVDNHDFPTSLEAIEELLRLQPENIDARAERVCLWFTVGDTTLVEEDAALLHELAPGSPQDLFAAAVTHSCLDPQEALTLLDQAITLDPGYERAWFARGILEHKQKNYPAAILNFEQASELAPRHAEVMFCLAEARMNAGQFHAAIWDYYDYLRTPEFSSAELVYQNLAYCFHQMALQERRQADQRWTKLRLPDYDEDIPF